MGISSIPLVKSRRGSVNIIFGNFGWFAIIW